MSVSSEADPEGGAWWGRVAGVVAEGGGEVDRPRVAEHADGEVAQAGHDAGAGASAKLGGGLGEGGGAFDRPRVAEHADGEVAQAGHDAGAGASAKLGGVLGEGDVADMVQRLD